MAFIVVGVDGSEAAQMALESAITQAVVLDAEVRAVCVVSIPPTSGYEFAPLVTDDLQNAARNTLIEAVERAKAAHGDPLPVPVSTKVALGHAGRSLVDEAESDDGAAMVAVGSRGYGAIRGTLLGSVTTYIVHHLPCPVLVVPGT